MRIERTSPPTRTGLRSDDLVERRTARVRAPLCEAFLVDLLGRLRQAIDEFPESHCKFLSLDTEEYVTQMASWRVVPSPSPVRTKLRTALIVAASIVVDRGGRGPAREHSPTPAATKPTTDEARANVRGRDSALKLEIGTVDVQSAGPPAKVKPPVRQRVLRRAQAYVDDAILAPLETGRSTTATQKLFDPVVKAAASDARPRRAHRGATGAASGAGERRPRHRFASTGSATRPARSCLSRPRSRERQGADAGRPAQDPAPHRAHVRERVRPVGRHRVPRAVRRSIGASAPPSTRRATPEPERRA